MIDAAKLHALSLETLTLLHKAIGDILKTKQRQVIRPGTDATFFNPRNGKTQRVRIMKMNPKSIGCIEVDDSGVPLHNRKWRIGLNLLTPYAAPVKPKPAPLGIGADRPSMEAMY